MGLTRLSGTSRATRTPPHRPLDPDPVLPGKGERSGEKKETLKLTYPSSSFRPRTFQFRLNVPVHTPSSLPGSGS